MVAEVESRPPQQRTGPEPPTAHDVVEVWLGEDGLWRYRYRDLATGVGIESNRGFGTREEALSSAALAYPGVLVVEVRLERSPVGGRAGKIMIVLLMAVLILGLLLLVAGGAVVMVLALRRLRKLLPGRT